MLHMTPSLSAAHHCDQTVARWSRSVTRAAAFMRDNLGGSVTLNQIAEVAAISPFHFVRVFSFVTGMPPNHYLAALRFQHAKELLMISNLSITDICFEVGFSSLGTFANRFTSLVGLPPSSFRRIMRDLELPFLMHAVMQHRQEPTDEGLSRRDEIAVDVLVPNDFEGIIFVGVFSDTRTYGPPASCVALTAPGRTFLRAAEGKWCRVMAAALPCMDARLLPQLLNPCLRASAELYPITHQGEQRNVLLELRPEHATDMPILPALPILLRQHLDRRAQAVAGDQQDRPADGCGLGLSRSVAAGAREMAAPEVGARP